MTAVQTLPPAPRTFADVLKRIGAPADRILVHPAPGAATIDDVIEIHRREGRLCELVDGTLVEKPMGFRESMLAMLLGRLLLNFVEPRNLGIVTGPDGMMALFAGLVRIPDVAFTSWARLPNQRVPNEPVPRLAPDLAVEILSRSNTASEMERKRNEYFEAGVKLVWLVDPESRTVAVFTTPLNFTTLAENEILDAGPVLPGFRLPLQDLFASLDSHGNG